MTTPSRRLYQFPLSLYCEKTRWNLDWKRLPWTAVNLLPGPHAFTAWRLAGQRRLPVLRDGAHCVGDSTRIALYLEERYPHPALLPGAADARREVLALEEYFDTLGDHVRRCVWSLAVDSAGVDAIFFRGYGARSQRLGRLARPLLRQMIRRTFTVRPREVDASWAAVHAGLAALEARLDTAPGGYLAGDRFTLADLTAASMLAPLVGPPESPWPDASVPGGHEEVRAALRETPAGRWVTAMYARHRHPGPA